MKKEREYDLQDRLVDYAVRIVTLSEALPETNELIAFLFASVETPRRTRSDSDSHLGCWIFLVGCWIFKGGSNTLNMGENGESVVTLG